MKTLITTLMLGALLVPALSMVSLAQQTPEEECSICSATPVAKYEWETDHYAAEFGAGVVEVIGDVVLCDGRQGGKRQAHDHRRC